MIVCDSVMANTDRHLRNFGLVRNIDDLRWRFAPIFDTGNSLWCDKDEGAVARGDYAFSSHPFSDMPNRQLMYAAELGWFDAGKLEGFADEACEILAEGDLCRWAPRLPARGHPPAHRCRAGAACLRSGGKVLAMLRPEGVEGVHEFHP